MLKQETSQDDITILIDFCSGLSKKIEEVNTKMKEVSNISEIINGVVKEIDTVKLLVDNLMKHRDDKRKIAIAIPKKYLISKTRKMKSDFEDGDYYTVEPFDNTVYVPLNNGDFYNAIVALLNGVMQNLYDLQNVTINVDNLLVSDNNSIQVQVTNNATNITNLKSALSFNTMNWIYNWTSANMDALNGNTNNPIGGNINMVNPPQGKGVMVYKFAFDFDIYTQGTVTEIPVTWSVSKNGTVTGVISQEFGSTLTNTYTFNILVSATALHHHRFHFEFFIYTTSTSVVSGSSITMNLNPGAGTNFNLFNLVNSSTEANIIYS